MHTTVTDLSNRVASNGIESVNDIEMISLILGDPQAAYSVVNFAKGDLSTISGMITLTLSPFPK